MPDVAFRLSAPEDMKEAERLERVLMRLGCVKLANVDTERGLVAVSYEGAATELSEIESAMEEAGVGFEPTPGARRMEE